MSADTHSSADLQREIETDRQRIEEKLHAIQERMSPGELMDEFIAYARRSGGSEFVANLGSAMKANPIPVALTGIGLAWLLADPASRAPQTSSVDKGVDDYPLAPVKGNLRRVGPIEATFGERYSHFEDQGGSRFRAKTDLSGRRAGHFVDPSGTVYRGFADASGQEIADIRDDEGNLFDETSGWASATWREVKEMASGVSNAGKSAAQSVEGLRQSAQDHGAQLNAIVLKTFRDQPLVGGALAFAIGAAIGAALPTTDLEDETAGEVSDRVRGQLKATADAAAEGAIEGAKNALGDPETNPTG